MLIGASTKTRPQTRAVRDVIATKSFGERAVWGPPSAFSFRRMPLIFAVALALAWGCTPVDVAGVPEDGFVDGCAFDDVAFDPHGGLVLQGVSSSGTETCVRLERAPLADVRRGTEWRAVSLSVLVEGRAIDVNDVNDDASDAIAYENSHHNCEDVVTALDDDVTLVIDGVRNDPNVCFSGAPEDWRLVLSVNGATHVLVPR